MNLNADFTRRAAVHAAIAALAALADRRRGPPHARPDRRRGRPRHHHRPLRPEQPLPRPRPRWRRGIPGARRRVPGRAWRLPGRVLCPQSARVAAYAGLGARLHHLRQALAVRSGRPDRGAARRAAADAYAPIPGRPGVEAVDLFNDDHEDVRLERWAAGANVSLLPRGGIELLVLEGGFSEGGDAFAPQSWLRLPLGDPFGSHGRVRRLSLWVKEGHLRRVPAPPSDP